MIVSACCVPTFVVSRRKYGNICGNRQKTDKIVVQNAEVSRMPLTMAEQGKKYTIQRIGGNEKTRLFLESLGFVTGGEVTVVSSMAGNLIVNVKESRVAIDQAMANKIMV